MKNLINIVVAVLTATTPLFSYGQSETASQLLFGYCGEITRGLGTATPGTTERAAIEIPADLAKKWAGNYITQILVGYGSSSQSEISVFLSYSLDEQPVYSQDAVVENQVGWNPVALDTPYLITGDSFFVGYGSYINNESDKPIGIDDIKNDSPYSGWIEIDGKWSNYAKFFGNVCIKILIEGESLPQNEVTLDNVSAPDLVQAGLPFSITLEIANNGAAAVETLSPACSIGDSPLDVAEITFPDGPVASQQTGSVILSGLVSQVTGLDLPLSVEISEVNGEKNESTQNTSLSVSIDCAEKCFPKQMVVEEYTGTWCGWCPQGIVAMKYMEENFGDKGFIGIAVHLGDEMQADSYAPLASIYHSSPGFPAATVNRGEVFVPSTESFIEYYERVENEFAPAMIDVVAKYDDESKSLTATATSAYSFDWDAAPYSLAFVITEDNVGPYLQSNYFSGGQMGQTLEGWTDKAVDVLTMYNEVAIEIIDLYGIEGSVPAAISALSDYEYTAILPTDKVKDLNNCKVIAILLDTLSGEIVCGAKTKIEGVTAMTGVEKPQDSSFKVFNIHGVKILETTDRSQLNSLPHGIYIINGEKVSIK